MRRKSKKGGARKKTARKVKRQAAKSKRHVKRTSSGTKRKAKRSGRKVKRTVKKAGTKAKHAVGAPAAPGTAPSHGQKRVGEENGPIEGELTVEEYEEDDFEEEPFGEEEEEFHPETSEDY